MKKSKLYLQNKYKNQTKHLIHFKIFYNRQLFITMYIMNYFVTIVDINSVRYYDNKSMGLYIYIYI